MQTLIVCVDKMINGHLILLQLMLVPVQPYWRRFGSAAGLDEEILDMVKTTKFTIKLCLFYIYKLLDQCTVE